MDKSVVALTLIALAACSPGPGTEQSASEPDAGMPSAPEQSAQAPGTFDAINEQLARLEHRKTLIEDANAIKRLQRSYGYYLDNALWDEMANLFADDGTIEIGLDGIYIGRERIREYLYALGDGQSGLSQGQLNEHMQLMPVVSVAPDGRTAQGRWRAVIMAGTLGEEAFWGEGPYENTYVKDDGVWKIQSAHWFQNMFVPYEGGWLTAADETGGKWVSDRLPPDRPPTVEYQMYPATYLPPFHFPNPVLGASARDWGASAQIPPQRSLDRLARDAAVLAQEVQLLEDENAIENLQRIYGFYIDKGFWSEAADLFTDDATIEIGASGVFEGKDRVLALLRSFGEEFPQDGRLFDRMQLQPVVHVAPDGQSARARWRLFAQEAQWHEFANWGVGVYENEYAKEDGVWKISRLHAYHRMYTPYEDGWGKLALPNGGSASALPADRPPSVDYAPYPAVFVPPFHYENPVTGAPVYSDSAADHASAPAASEAELSALIDTLASAIERLEDVDALERLNAIYGYYLAHSQWDNLAGIFAPNGAIEIALRGVYVGRPSVRRNLNLYTEVGMEHGLLHNHMQYQPVITVAEDGQTAKMRSRAFSIMGEFETYAMFMGGIYENDFVKIDGVWQINKDQQINTYFVPYALGWKEAVPRPPPGITESNPPDLPPTMPFEMYPSAFVPPYHYPNPVTGNVVSWTPED